MLLPHHCDKYLVETTNNKKNAFWLVGSGVSFIIMGKWGGPFYLAP